MKNLSLICLIIPLFFIGCNSSNTVEDNSAATANWAVLENPEYYIKYPSGWQADLQGKGGSFFIIYSPDIVPAGKFHSNINLMAKPTKETELKGFVDKTIQSLRGSMANFVVHNSKSIKNGHEIEFSGDMGDFKIRYIQRIEIKDGYAYVLSFSSDRGKYKEYKADALRIMSTYTLKK